MPGLGVADTASALAGVREQLARTLRDTAQRLLDEPRLEVRATLAVHLHEDARSLIELDGRIEELGGATTARAITAHELLTRIDPLVDEHTLRVLTKLVHRERRHADEADPRLHPPRERIPDLDDDPHAEAAQQAVRALLERDDPAFQRDMARIAADSLRHAVIAAGDEAARDHVRAEQALHARLRERWQR